jgi:hypothetical protein
VIASGGADDWAPVIDGFVDPPSGGRIRPSADASAVYRDLRQRYAALEAETLRRDASPDAE